MNGSAQLTEHFTIDELATCHHCGAECPNDNPLLLAARLEVTRARVGVPMQVLSGWRCQTRQWELYTAALAAGKPAAKKSFHTVGLAADLRYAIPGSVKQEIEYLIQDGWHGIEVKAGADGVFISVHLDLRAHEKRWIVDVR